VSNDITIVTSPFQRAGNRDAAVTTAPLGSWLTFLIRKENAVMAVARVTEISSTSNRSFEDAVQQGIARATKTLRNVKGAWIKEQRVDVDGDRIVQYQVNLMVTFVLED
jgi:flavin-binding protein dodecin